MWKWMFIYIIFNLCHVHICLLDISVLIVSYPQLDETRATRSLHKAYIQYYCDGVYVICVTEKFTIKRGDPHIFHAIYSIRCKANQVQIYLTIIVRKYLDSILSRSRYSPYELLCISNDKMILSYIFQTLICEVAWCVQSDYSIKDTYLHVSTNVQYYEGICNIGHISTLDHHVREKYTPSISI